MRFKTEKLDWSLIDALLIKKPGVAGAFARQEGLAVDGLVPHGKCWLCDVPSAGASAVMPL